MFLIVVKYSCLHFHCTSAPHPTCPRLPPWNPPLLALSLCPSYLSLDGPPLFSPRPLSPTCSHCQFRLFFISVLGIIYVSIQMGNSKTCVHTAVCFPEEHEATQGSLPPAQPDPPPLSVTAPPHHSACCRLFACSLSSGHLLLVALLLQLLLFCGWRGGLSILCRVGVNWI